MLLMTVAEEETYGMLDDLTLAPREEDEMEDFHYGDDGDDMESKLDTYDEAIDDDDDDEVVVVRTDVVAIPLAAEGSAGQVAGEGGGGGDAPARKPVSKARKAAP